MNKIISLNDLWAIYNLPSHLVAVLTNKGEFEQVNASFTSALGYEEEALCGKPFVSFIHPEDLPLEIMEASRINRKELCHQTLKRIRSSKGIYRLFSWSFTKPPGSNRIYATARYCTEKMEMEQMGGYVAKPSSQHVSRAGLREEQTMTGQKKCPGNVAWKKSQPRPRTLTTLQSLIIFLKEESAEKYVKYMQYKMKKTDNVIQKWFTRFLSQQPMNRR